MWICLNDAFFSIVNDGRYEDELLVRARREGDLKKVFGVEETRTPHRDYLFRAYINKAVVAEVIASRIVDIDYDNFKDSVDDTLLHDTYAAFWSKHYAMQQQLKR